MPNITGCDWYCPQCGRCIPAGEYHSHESTAVPGTTEVAGYTITFGGKTPMELQLNRIENLLKQILEEIQNEKKR